MTHLTVKARAATFTLDQLMSLRRRGIWVCLYCGMEDRPPRGVRTCANCHHDQLRDPEDLIAMNLEARRIPK